MSGATAGEARGGEAEVMNALPGWLQPGVSPGIHIGLRAVLATLNALLGYCAVAHVFSPHFEVMFGLSLALTACYFWFISEVGRIAAVDAATRAARTASGDAGGDAGGAAVSADVTSGAMEKVAETATAVEEPDENGKDKDA